MSDQAEKLRKMLMEKYSKTARTIAVVSGKGGVGKSNITVNSAISIAQRGKKVLVFDFDIGMGNIDVLLGIDSQNNISNYIKNNLSINDIVYTGPYNISYISAGNGFAEVLELDQTSIRRLLAELEDLQHLYDFIIFDMGAGATKTNLQVLLSVEDIIVITTPEPTSITDAYSMMKYISINAPENNLFLICNRSEREKEGKLTLERLQSAMKKFLNKDIHSLGILPEDSHVRKAVIRQEPFYSEFPHSPISAKLEQIVQNYLGENKKYDLSQTNHFIRKLRSFFER
ncbi:MinD/ParA family protein [Heyndrickxia sp. NPDC080065]|uniref:MinD/ParA family protein n=1 Tax=Heyndrickxia sp. NPDC080065 TaxID=3390568 RepID=UPI003D04184E